MKLVRANAHISEELSTAGRQQATKQLKQNLYTRLADSLLQEASCVPIKYLSIPKLFFQLNGGHQTKKRSKVLGLSYLINEHPPWYICLLLGFQVLTIGLKEFCVFLFILYDLRDKVSIHRTNLKYCGKSPKIHFPPTFIFCSPIFSNNCGVVFLRKYILVFEK